MSKNSEALKSKYGDDYFSKLGKKGFETTRDKYYEGDGQALVRFLLGTGKWSPNKKIQQGGIAWNNPIRHDKINLTNNDT